MFTHAQFNQLLDTIGPVATRSKERRTAIDQYDSIRKKVGIAEAEKHLAGFVKMTGEKLKLKSIADQLQDFSAKNRIAEIISSGDEERIATLSEKLDTDLIAQAVRAQGLDENAIRRLAQPYSTSENPTGHLKARRWLRKQAKQATATLNMILKLIGKNGNQHCTQYEIFMRNQQKARWLKFGEETVLKQTAWNTDKETGESVMKINVLSMADIMKSSGKKRCAEILTLTKGLENYAIAQGLTWIFITITAPPEMHSNPKKGRDSWDGTTPDEAHKWIQEKHKNAVERLRKEGIIPSGVRVVEPHDDACPHWHLLYFVRPEDVQEIEDKFRVQDEWKSEAGMKFVINNGKAKASSYLMKYVLKTVGAIEKLEGEHATVDAWRSTWGMRAFAFLGMPPVGLWRKLRALKISPMDGSLCEIWQAVQDGNGCEFIRLAGGLNCKSKDRPFRAFQEKTDTLERAAVKRICFENRISNTTTFFDNDKYKQEKIENVQVIPNCPRNPNPTPTPQNQDQNEPGEFGKLAFISSEKLLELKKRTPPSWWRDDLLKIGPTFKKENEMIKETSIIRIETGYADRDYTSERQTQTKNRNQYAYDEQREKNWRSKSKSERTENKANSITTEERIAFIAEIDSFKKMNNRFPSVTEMEKLADEFLYKQSSREAPCL